MRRRGWTYAGCSSYSRRHDRQRNPRTAQVEADEARRAYNAKVGPNGGPGAGVNQFGVKQGDIREIAKKIQTDHDLALKLWNTGNVAARLGAWQVRNKIVGTLGGTP